MKIPKINIPPVNPYQANDMKVQKSAEKATQTADRLEISSEAKHLSEASSYTTARNEKVQAIQSQIESGTYKVSPDQIAQGLIDYYNK